MWRKMCNFTVVRLLMTVGRNSEWIIVDKLERKKIERYSTIGWKPKGIEICEEASVPMGKEFYLVR